MTCILLFTMVGQINDVARIFQKSHYICKRGYAKYLGSWRAPSVGSSSFCQLPWSGHRAACSLLVTSIGTSHLISLVVNLYLTCWSAVPPDEGIYRDHLGWWWLITNQKMVSNFDGNTVSSVSTVRCLYSVL